MVSSGSVGGYIRNTLFSHRNSFPKALVEDTRVLRVFLSLWGEIIKISSLLKGKIVLKTWLVVSVALENCRGERARRKMRGYGRIVVI